MSRGGAATRGLLTAEVGRADQAAGINEGFLPVAPAVSLVGAVPAAGPGIPPKSSLWG